MPLRVENRCAVLGFIGLRFKVGKLEGGGPRPPVWSDGVGQFLPAMAGQARIADRQESTFMQNPQLEVTRRKGDAGTRSRRNKPNIDRAHDAVDPSVAGQEQPSYL